jgi:hypothetical protein
MPYSFDDLISCRRLFLKGLRPRYPAGPSKVDIEILVELVASISSRDEIEDVVDYNVMRDTLLVLQPSPANDACSSVARALTSHTGIRAARVTMVGADGRVFEGESRKIAGVQL